MYNYSIIIPHYKIIKLLERCLNSIPDRPDIQIIVVDDNSGIDKTEFKKLNRFKNAKCDIILSEKGGGAGFARNIGLQYAEGKWLLFADADDLYAPNAFCLFDSYLDSDSDIVYFDTESLDSDTLKPSSRNKIYHMFISQCDNKDTDSINWVKCQHSVPYSKMIRRSLVDSQLIKFDETRYCNDTMFSVATALSAKKIYVDHRVAYYVTTRDGSLVTHSSASALLIRYEVILRANKLIRERGYDKYQNSIVSYFRKCMAFNISTLYRCIVLGFKYDGFNKYTLKRWKRMVAQK